MLVMGWESFSEGVDENRKNVWTPLVFQCGNKTNKQNILSSVYLDGEWSLHNSETEWAHPSQTSQVMNCQTSQFILEGKKKSLLHFTQGFWPPTNLYVRLYNHYWPNKKKVIFYQNKTSEPQPTVKERKDLSPFSMAIFS